MQTPYIKTIKNVARTGIPVLIRGSHWSRIGEKR